MRTKIVTEIISLHEFFSAWFRGDSDATIGRLETALDQRFVMISPNGARIDRADVISAVEAGHGSRPITIRIKQPDVSWVHDDFGLATYEEWQESDSDTTGRVSTALFRADPAAPNGVVWMHLHETWITPSTDLAIDP